MSYKKEIVQQIVIAIPTVISTSIGLFWAILHFHFSQNLQASIEIFVYLFVAGLLAGML